MSAKDQPSKKKAIRKGIRFTRCGKDFKPGLIKAPLPEIVTIPLKQGFGSENIPLVKKGDKVKVGQIIGRGDKSICSPVHSSVSGQVIDIVEVDYIHEELKESLEEKVRAVKIKTAQGQTEKPVEGAGSDWAKKDPVKIRKLLYLAGVSCLAQTGIPTEYASSPFSADKIKNIVINGVVSELFVHSLVQSPEEVENHEIGLNILSHAFPQAKVHVALSKYVFQRFKGYNGFADKVKLYSVKPKHPQGLSEVLIQNLFGEKLPPGKFFMDKGILALPEDAPLIIYQAVVEGKSFIRKRFSVGGSAVKQKAICEVPIGTSLKEAIHPLLCKDMESNIVLGGALSGYCQEDLSLPIGKEINSIVALEKVKEREFLFFMRPGLKRLSYSRTFLSSLRPKKEKEADAGVHGEKRPCVYCGFCEQVCPADILPYQIYQCCTHELTDEAERLKPLECIDCGLCSYVCPSKLPLAETLKICKSKLSKNPDFIPYTKKEGRIMIEEKIFAGVCEKDNWHRSA